MQSSESTRRKHSSKKLTCTSTTGSIYLINSRSNTNVFKIREYHARNTRGIRDRHTKWYHYGQPQPGLHGNVPPWAWIRILQIPTRFQIIQIPTRFFRGSTTLPSCSPIRPTSALVTAEYKRSSTVMINENLVFTLNQAFNALTPFVDSIKFKSYEYNIVQLHNSVA